MKTKQSTKAASAKTRKIWERTHPNCAVCTYVPKAHKAWLERRAEAEGKSVGEFLAQIIKLVYDFAK